MGYFEFEIVPVAPLCGRAASVYTVRPVTELGAEEPTLFDAFLEEMVVSHRPEVLEILGQLKVITNKTGFRPHFVKYYEGIPGDGVCALYDLKKSKLRLYCIQYGRSLMVLGGGGAKPKHIRTLQEDEKLMKENYLMRAISQRVTARILNKEIEYSDDYSRLEGNLVFRSDDLN